MPFEIKLLLKFILLLVDKRTGKTEGRKLIFLPFPLFLYCKHWCNSNCEAEDYYKILSNAADPRPMSERASYFSSGRKQVQISKDKSGRSQNHWMGKPEIEMPLLCLRCTHQLESFSEFLVHLCVCVLHWEKSWEEPTHPYILMQTVIKNYNHYAISYLSTTSISFPLLQIT